MKYVYIIENTALEIIPEFVDMFPGVPVSSRYSGDFLSQCVEVLDDVEVLIGWVYDPDTGKFSEPPPMPEPEPVPEPDLPSPLESLSDRKRMDSLEAAIDALVEGLI